MSIDKTMYTLGQIARAIHPDGDIPAGTLDTLLSRPATGLALLLKSAHAKRVEPDDLARLINLVPAGLSDPIGGVKIESQGPFWTGWYRYATAIDHSARLTIDHLARAGRLLYGDRWQSDIARALDVNDRQVRAWMAGERRIPPGVWADIAALLRQRSNEGMALLAEFRR